MRVYHLNCGNSLVGIEPAEEVGRQVAEVRRQFGVLRDGLSEGILSDELPFILGSWGRLQRAKVNWKILQQVEEERQGEQEGPRHRARFQVVRSAEATAPSSRGACVVVRGACSAG